MLIIQQSAHNKLSQKLVIWLVQSNCNRVQWKIHRIYIIYSKLMYAFVWFISHLPFYSVSAVAMITSPPTFFSDHFDLALLYSPKRSPLFPCFRLFIFRLPNWWPYILSFLVLELFYLSYMCYGTSLLHPFLKNMEYISLELRTCD